MDDIRDEGFASAGLPSDIHHSLRCIDRGLFREAELEVNMKLIPLLSLPLIFIAGGIFLFTTNKKLRFRAGLSAIVGIGGIAIYFSIR